MVKKIHYCWFGGKELPNSVKKCINTWKKILPDYEIKEWNEESFDINTCSFVKEAYENKKWAFVSDYVRIYALYQEGGIYLDTDMKLIKDISYITDKEMFLGYEDSGYVGTAVIGVKEKNNKYIKEILDYYNGIEHFNAEIMYNYANPVIITKLIKKYSSYTNEQGIRIFDNNIYIYPRDYFYPLSYNYSEKIYTDNTCMVHLFSATWTDKGEKRVIGIYRKFGPRLGKVLNRIIDKVFGFKSNAIYMLKKPYSYARMKYSIYINRYKRIRQIKEDILNKKTKNYLTICHPEMIEQNDGINELFSDNILNIREMHTQKEAKQIAQIIVDDKIKMVIFNGYINGWNIIMSELKKLNKDIIIKILIHGGDALLSTKENNWNSLNIILDLYNKMSIDELGFFKKSLYEFYKEKGYNAKLITKYPNIENKQPHKVKKEEKNIKVGLYEAYDLTAKNVYNQLSAVSLLENARLDCSPINYKISMMARKYNINLCGTSKSLSKEELYKKMSENDINLYVTLLDESKLLPLESLELGIPCLVGSSYECFDGSELEKYLVVTKEDNIMQIYSTINNVIKNKEKIMQIYDEWKKEYIGQAKANLERFLSIK